MVRWIVGLPYRFKNENFYCVIWVKNTVILKTEGSGNHELQIEMYNIIGRRVKSVRLDEDSKEIDVSNLENGIYILGINAKEHQQKIKFTIQR